jgi:hypothetical protein
MEKAAAGVDSAGVDAEEEDDNDDGSGHKHDGRVVVYLEFLKPSTLYESEWAGLIKDAEDEKKRNEYLKEVLVPGGGYEHSKYRFDIQKKSAVNDGKGKKRVVFCISRKTEDPQDGHSNSSSNISMPLMEARHIAKCMASWKVLCKATSHEMYFTARDRDKARILFAELLKRQKSKERVTLGTVGREVLKHYCDQVPTKRWFVRKLINRSNRRRNFATLVRIAMPCLLRSRAQHNLPKLPQLNLISQLGLKIRIAKSPQKGPTIVGLYAKRNFWRPTAQCALQSR